MTERRKISLIYFCVAMFVAIGLFFVAAADSYLFFALPFVVGVLMLYIFSSDKVLLLIAFLTPLSIELDLKDSGIGVSFPCDVLLLGLLFVFIAKLLYEKKFDLQIAKHPISIAIYALLGWMVVTMFTSEFPVVSLKHVLSQLWFIVPSFFMCAILFKDVDNIKKFLWFYIASLMLVVCYTIVNHAVNAFDHDAAHWVMTPFYNDHTAYGAALAMFLVISAAFLFMPMRRRWKMLVFGVFALLAVALVLSSCRAAWISVVAALMVFVCVLLKIKFKWLLSVGIIMIALFFAFQSQILGALEKNDQDASGDFAENIQSMTNISTDASNLERLNRWNCAFRMFHERPITGWGFGTYQFFYGAFQKQDEKTIISTSSGDMGNAHSEYIGPLAEMGLPGMLLMIVLVSVGIGKGLLVYNKKQKRETKILVLGVTLALITYFVHGVMNNFLDTDKLAVPVWSCFAIITAIDVFHSENDVMSNEHS